MSQIQTRNPATGEVLETYEVMGEQEVFAKIDSAHDAFLDWRSKSHEERAPYLRKIAGVLRDNSERFSELMTREMGKLLRDGKTEVELCARLFEYAADKGPEELADQERTHSGGKKRGIVTFSPIGVIYSVQPWNFPLYQPVRVLAANLIAGNSVILKHASICTGSGLLLRDLCEEAGLPKGLFDVIIVGHDLSDKVIEHKLIRAVTMTGSDYAGSHIGELASKNLKKTVLELGSNDAYLVLEDADIETAVKTCVMGRLYNNGETCVSAGLHRDRRGLRRIRFRLRRTDEGRDHGRSDQGRHAARAAFQQGTVRHDRRAGFQKHRPGRHAALRRRSRRRCRLYYPATVLADCKPGMPAYDDELFGPVASVIRAKNDEDAMRLANDSRYGLGGGILCGDTERAIELASKHFDTGMVYINTYGVADPSMPFGGVKNSGYGKEHGGFGIKEFVNAKAIFLPS